MDALDEATKLHAFLLKRNVARKILMRITRITAIERGFFVKTFWTCLSAFCKPVTFDSCLNVNAFSGTNTTETINIYK